MKKTKKELEKELMQLRGRIAKFEVERAQCKKTKKELRLFKAIVESSNEAIAVSDADGMLLYINPAHEKLFGRSLQEASKINYRDYYPPESITVLDREVAPALLRGESWEGELDVYDASGRRFPLWERADTIRDDQGQMLYGFGLMHDVTKSRQVENLLRQRTHSLSERVKELNCLYGISEVEARPRATMEKILQNVVNLIPSSWQYPEVTCARIILKGQEFRTHNFKETAWKQRSKIVVQGQNAGLIEVCYLNDMPDDREEPFLAEEELLLKTVAERVGGIIERLKAQENLKALTKELLQIQEKERRRISNDLHDRVAQDLVALKIAFKTLMDDMPCTSPDLTAKVNDIATTLQACIDTIRNISHELHPPELSERGLVETLAMYCDDFATVNRIKVKFSAAGIEKLNLDTTAQINLYRMVQEGLNNIRKHAAATLVIIELAAAHSNVVLHIEDNGKGFDISKSTREMAVAKCFGLHSLQERANLLGGTLSISSKKGYGTRVSIKLPFAKTG